MTDKTQAVEVTRVHREAVARMLVSAGVYVDIPLAEPSMRELTEWVATGEHPDETCRRGLEAFVQALQQAGAAVREDRRWTGERELAAVRAELVKDRAELAEARSELDQTTEALRLSLATVEAVVAQSATTRYPAVEPEAEQAEDKTSSPSPGVSKAPSALLPYSQGAGDGAGDYLTRSELVSALSAIRGDLGGPSAALAARLVDELEKVAR